MARCNVCRIGSAEFLGHEFNNNTSKIYSVFKCTHCGAPVKIERPAVGPGGFDIEHPEAHKRMLPTPDWVARETKRLGIFDGYWHRHFNES